MRIVGLQQHHVDAGAPCHAVLCRACCAEPVVLGRQRGRVAMPSCRPMCVLCVFGRAADLAAAQFKPELWLLHTPCLLPRLLPCCPAVLRTVAGVLHLGNIAFNENIRQACWDLALLIRDVNGPELSLLSGSCVATCTQAAPLPMWPAFASALSQHYPFRFRSIFPNLQRRGGGGRWRLDGGAGDRGTPAGGECKGVGARCSCPVLPCYSEVLGLAAPLLRTTAPRTPGLAALTRLSTCFLPPACRCQTWGWRRR